MSEPFRSVPEAEPPDWRERFPQVAEAHDHLEARIESGDYRGAQLRKMRAALSNIRGIMQRSATMTWLKESVDA